MALARCMLPDAKLQKKYWEEDINMANFLQEHLPTIACNKTPYELWNEEKPIFKNYKLFGTISLVKFTDQTNT